MIIFIFILSKYLFRTLRLSKKRNSCWSMSHIVLSDYIKVLFPNKTLNFLFKLQQSVFFSFTISMDKKISNLNNDIYFNLTSE